MTKKSARTPNITHQINLAKQTLDGTPAWIRGDGGQSVARQHKSSGSGSTKARGVRASRKK